MNTIANQIRLLLKPKEAAEALAVSERTLWQLTKDRIIPCVRIGRAVRYDLAQLQGWIANQREATHESKKTENCT